jgi:hypothetical protein
MSRILASLGAAGAHGAVATPHARERAALLRRLLDGGAPVDLGAINARLETPVHCALRSCSLELLEARTRPRRPRRAPGAARVRLRIGGRAGGGAPMRAQGRSLAHLRQAPRLRSARASGGAARSATWRLERAGRLAHCGRRAGPRLRANRERGLRAAGGAGGLPERSCGALGWCHPRRARARGR